MLQSQSKQKVTIKGNKDGLTVHLDDRCAFEELIEELQEKMTEEGLPTGEGPEIHVNVDVGYRYIPPEDEHAVIQTIEQHGRIHVANVHSQVISKYEAEEQKKETEIAKVARIVRSGQVVHTKGDLLLLGDVNPGGTVEATGSIYVMGTLQGMARAGIEGRGDAYVAAGVMNPAQIMINESVYIAADENVEENGQSTNDVQESPCYAYINGKDIQFDKMRGFSTR
ncbi:septum site-determining protein MinC [Salsuginibacillus halophilus]|uniref:Probable septum site-determining protein MinC n=1 Tax=Salsuginibacillus halophilus TaxID=517424 RepID=A0A2P8HCL3_9BACI|nr:septum site-determining protein MinC [Salsuginibacillus halophilus]PSL43967.1 septum site-determining protein MinC [Salsuginibacillus halophilus]